MLYGFLPSVCNMQVEFLQSETLLCQDSAWIQNRSGNRFRDHVATKKLHDAFIYIYIYIYMYRCVFCIRFRGYFPVIFQAHVFSQRNRSATRSGPFTASCVSEMQLEFFPQGPPKQPPPLDRWPSGVLEDVRIPSPAFVPCFYGHLAMCV